MDKLKHFGACFIIALIVGLLFSPLIGATVAAALGVGKEWYDNTHGGKFDWYDLLADCAGIVAAMILVP